MPRVKSVGALCCDYTNFYNQKREYKKNQIGRFEPYSTNSLIGQILKNNFIASSKINDKTSFRGLPYEINEYIPYQLSGENALRIYDKFRLGNYLDLNGGEESYRAKRIRNRNLAFLDNVTAKEDKKKFIDGYCALTGFPNMKKVSQNIQNEFISACQKTQSFLQREFPYYSSAYEIVGAGYDGVSSVARNTAFPGSDMDKAYVILRGNDDDFSNELTVKNFKWRLWENTDQRLLSYNHDLSSFPEVYTLKQINAISNAINNVANAMNLHEKKQLPQTFMDVLRGRVSYAPSKYDNYKEITQSFTDDYVKANQFMIDVLSQFPSSRDWNKPLDLNRLTREDVYKASFLLEAICKGEQLIGEKIPLTLSPDAKELINLSQINAIKSTSTPKEKYQKRKTLEQDFPTWSIDKQFDFIKNMIKASCSDNTEFPEYYKSAEVDRYNVLLKRLDLVVNND